MWYNRLKINEDRIIFFTSLILAAYYLLCGIYLQKAGYTNHESLFYIEKIRIIFEGVGSKLKVIGLTAPALPFLSTFIFTAISPMLAPVIASSLGTAALFFLMARAVRKRKLHNYYFFLLLAIFLFHPGMLFVACSGKSIYMVLVFFYMFFENIFKYYYSNTTFHISVASICLLMLLFCDYKFVWLTLFFIPLIFAMAVRSLNLGEKESIFRMTISFNNPSLRRKLTNKTFALYLILFILPIASIICYKMLNLTNANDADYFLESPYATWTVLADRLAYDATLLNSASRNTDISLLISAKILLFCPMMLLGIYLFRYRPHLVLTLITPFALLEFLHLKYLKTITGYQDYLIFLILALLSVIITAPEVKRQRPYKIVLTIMMAFQFYTGYYFLNNSESEEENGFLTALLNRNKGTDAAGDEERDVANYINSLPADAKVLVDDAVAYKIAAFTRNIASLTMPYQDSFLSAVESPGNFTRYILVASPQHPMAAYTILSASYPPVAYHEANNTGLQKVYQTNNWILYKIF